jgi:hypothetical protein
MPEVFDASKKPDLFEKAREFVTEKLNPHDAVDAYSKVMRDSVPSTNPFDAFAAKPLSVYSFDSQHEDEQVLLLLRKHPITQLGNLLIIVFMLLFPLLFPYAEFYQALPMRFQSAVLMFWYLLTLAFSLEAFLSWFFNVYIVTDERIIDIDFLSLIYKNISSAKIDNIEDVTATTGGALRSVFDYGTIKVQTAAATAEFEFEDVPQPNRVTQFLNEMMLEEEREKIEGRVR